MIPTVVTIVLVSFLLVVTDCRVSVSVEVDDREQKPWYHNPVEGSTHSEVRKVWHDKVNEVEYEVNSDENLADDSIEDQSDEYEVHKAESLDHSSDSTNFIGPNTVLVQNNNFPKKRYVRKADNDEDKVRQKFKIRSNEQRQKNRTPNERHSRSRRQADEEDEDREDDGPPKRPRGRGQGRRNDRPQPPGGRGPPKEGFRRGRQGCRRPPVEEDGGNTTSDGDRESSGDGEDGNTESGPGPEEGSRRKREVDLFDSGLMAKRFLRMYRPMRRFDVPENETEGRSDFPRPIPGYYHNTYHMPQPHGGYYPYSHRQPPMFNPGYPSPYMQQQSQYPPPPPPMQADDSMIVGSGQPGGWWEWKRYEEQNYGNLTDKCINAQHGYWFWHSYLPMPAYMYGFSSTGSTSYSGTPPYGSNNNNWNHNFTVGPTYSTSSVSYDSQSTASYDAGGMETSTFETTSQSQ